jgi:Spy/CpxP family protein refolding chaperone
LKRILTTAALLSAAFIAMPACAQQHDHQGTGEGMIHDHGGMGEGSRGMMHGDGMGAGMMGGHHSEGYAGLKLSSDQRAKLDDIQRELQQKREQLMSRMHKQGLHMHDPLALASVDEATARKAFDAMSMAMKEMFEASLEAGKRMNAVLTDEQRQQLRRGRQ